MAELKNSCPPESATFKEAVCIDAGRVYDSCCDRDCLEDLRCYFTHCVQEKIEHAISIRLHSAEVLKTDIRVEPVTFNKGYYTCDLTFFFLLSFDLYLSPHCCPEEIKGVAVFSKKAILYGSEGSVKTFSSTSSEDESGEFKPYSKRGNNNPRCVVQCVDPIPLSARLGEINDRFDTDFCVPKSVYSILGDELETKLECGRTTVYVTLGLFTIVQLIRNVQMLVPVYDFCIPEKQCDSTTDQPCDIFKRIKFPTDDFFPPRPYASGDSCGCSRKS